MCEKCQNNQSFLNGAVIGGLIGAAIGFLYAPQPGTETRKKLRESAETFKERAEPVIDDLSEKVVPILKEMQTASAPVRQEFIERVNQLVDEVEGKIQEEKRSVAKKKLFAGLNRPL